MAREPPRTAKNHSAWSYSEGGRAALCTLRCVFVGSGLNPSPGPSAVVSHSTQVQDPGGAAETHKNVTRWLGLVQESVISIAARGCASGSRWPKCSMSGYFSVCDKATGWAIETAMQHTEQNKRIPNKRQAEGTCATSVHVQSLSRSPGAFVCDGSNVWRRK